MPDSIDPPVFSTPLLTAQGLAVCGKFSADLADLCNAASLAGMTPNMICGQLWNMTMLIGFQVKDDVDALPPEPAPAPTPPTVTDQPLTLTNGISDVPLVAGNSVTLTVGDLTTPSVDMQVLALALGTDFSLELKYTAHDGFTYTANGLWPGVTLYGKVGDLMRLSIEGSSGIVTSTISQDAGATWTNFFLYGPQITAPTYVHVESTSNAGVAAVTARR